VKYEISVSIEVDATDPESAWNKIAELCHSATFLDLIGKHDASDPVVMEPVNLEGNQ
jgi:hypothetical protein